MLEALEAVEVAEMDAEALRIEADHWRSGIGDLIQCRRAELSDLRCRRRPWLPGARRERVAFERSLAGEISMLVGLLGDVLEGECGDRCGICGEAIAPGAAVLRDVEMGEVHAGCMGGPMEGDGPIAPGDKVQCEPEGIVDANDDPVPDSDGVLVAHACRPWWTVETLAREANLGRQIVGVVFGEAVVMWSQELAGL